MSSREFGQLSHPDQCVVLIVDDEVIVRNGSQMILESEGYFVLTADNSAEAGQISKQYPAPIHILLMDVRMPSINGVHLKDEIIRQRPCIKVVVLSRRIANWQSVTLLRKPFERDELRETIRGVLRDGVNVPTCKSMKARKRGA
jgi:YesN/AraC family two-component response regulator